MNEQEVGRWLCVKCGKNIVAAAQVVRGRRGIGAYTGPCPWDCGAWINRGFREVRSGGVRALRAGEWDDRSLTATQ